jgi:hypothetical protein
MESFELQRLQELKAKFHMDGLQLERRCDRAANIQRSAQEFVDENERAVTQATKRYMAVGSANYKGSKLNLFFEVHPNL